jgi:hypothetical protein
MPRIRTGGSGQLQKQRNAALADDLRPRAGRCRASSSQVPSGLNFPFGSMLFLKPEGVRTNAPFLAVSSSAVLGAAAILGRNLR